MFKEAYEQIKISYEKCEIYPPILLADSSLGDVPSLIFLVVSNGKVDGVVVNSQNATIMGVTALDSNPMKESAKYDIDIVDKAITNVCMLLLASSDMDTIKDAYTSYLTKCFGNQNDINVAASFCPNAVSKDILRNLGNTPRESKNVLSQIGRKIVFMEKDMPEVIKNIPQWIDNIPVAKAYKNAIVAGNGSRLFRVIKLSGNPAAYQTCLEDFSQFLFNMKMVEDATISETNSGCIHSNVQQVNEQPGHYWFFDDDHNPQNNKGMITFDISNVICENQRIKDLISALGLITEYSTMEMLLDCYPGWEIVSEADFINNTILAHYANSSDDILKPSDLDWLGEFLGQTGSTETTTETKGEQVTESNVITSEDTASSNTIVLGERNEKPSTDEEKQSSEENIILPTAQIEVTPISEGDTPVMEQMVSENIDSQMTEQSDTSPIQPQNETQTKTEVDNAETPLVVADDNYQPETAESAAAKRKANQELGRSIYAVYEATADRLKAERDVRWKDFISDYRKAMEEGIYNVRTAKRYLQMTNNDIRNPIYAVLYNADKETAKYEASLQRIKKPTLCFACHTGFDADLTFAQNKEHVAKCPNCGNLVRMTIEWM